VISRDPTKLHLPKQWRHWLGRSGLRPAFVGRRPYCYLYFKGRGFYWRIAYHYNGDLQGKYTIQRGDTYSRFDRWALCRIYELQHTPTTFAELKQFVDTAVNFWAIQTDSYVSVESIDV
jgi:hypothetical protein